jgi:hypothetical protein
MTYPTATTAPTAPRSSRPGGLRPTLVRGLLTCLSLTALLGIYAVLTASFDETGARVLTSTLLTGLYCLLCLADVSVLDTRYRAVGLVGLSAATTALAQGLVLVWSIGDDLPDDTLWLVARSFLLTGVVAVAVAHVALLLRLDLPAGGAPARLRTATLVVVGAVAALLAAAVVQPDLGAGGGYWRLLGTLGILDVLGTACLPVVARLAPLDGRSAR